jgi:hypothetical protein
MMNLKVTAAVAMFLFVPALVLAGGDKTYKHASQYQVATLDQTLRVVTGADVTVANTRTDAKLAGGGQGIHLLYTDQGNYRVEAPVNKGRSFAAAMLVGMANENRPAWQQEQAPTIHNKWFLDGVQPGTKVLFAAECARPNKKHPYETVRCNFYLPDPDSTNHEYETIGDFTPYQVSDGSNIQKTANTLCGTGKLNPATEAQLCGQAPAAPSSAPATVPPAVNAK